MGRTLIFRTIKLTEDYLVKVLLEYFVRMGKTTNINIATPRHNNI